MKIIKQAKFVNTMKEGIVEMVLTVYTRIKQNKNYNS